MSRDSGFLVGHTDWGFTESQAMVGTAQTVFLAGILHSTRVPFTNLTQTLCFLLPTPFSSSWETNEFFIIGLFFTLHIIDSCFLFTWHFSSPLLCFICKQEVLFVGVKYTLYLFLKNLINFPFRFVFSNSQENIWFNDLSSRVFWVFFFQVLSLAVLGTPDTLEQDRIFEVCYPGVSNLSKALFSN